MSNGGRHAVKVVVVPDRIRQPVEVVGRAERLGDLLVEAVAHVLRRRVERQEDRRTLEGLLVRPANPAADDLRRMKLCQSVSPGTMKQAAVGNTRVICGRGDRLDGDLRPVRIVGLGNVDPRLGPQAAESAPSRSGR